METLQCPTCQGIVWNIYGELFETGGTLVELLAECSACGHRLNLGVVDGKGIH
jgi:hypothetical protein